MSYAPIELRNRIAQMHPGIGENSIAVDIAFSREKDTFIIILRWNNSQLLVTHIERQEADGLMDGNRSKTLFMQIQEFIKKVNSARKDFGEEP